jgi:uncharacterized oxidoreductase
MKRNQRETVRQRTGRHKMKLAGNTILVTGGASGIGFAFTERFLKNNKVIICGRRQDALDEAKRKYPQLIVRSCDIAEVNAREELFNWVISEHPDVNVLVNNAGVQHRVRLQDSGKDWSYHQQELSTNLEAPIHLITLFLNHLAKKDGATIINVTSGLAFIPIPLAPVYCATKAAMHSFTMTLRHQLVSSGIEVIEIAPPSVNTDLGGTGLHTTGVPLDEFADAVFQKLGKGLLEIGYGPSERGLHVAREEFDAFLKFMSNGPK